MINSSDPQKSFSIQQIIWIELSNTHQSVNLIPNTRLSCCLLPPYWPKNYCKWEEIFSRETEI